VYLATSLIHATFSEAVQEAGVITGRILYRGDVRLIMDLYTGALKSEPCPRESTPIFLSFHPTLSYSLPSGYMLAFCALPVAYPVYLGDALFPSAALLLILKQILSNG
jgi:hypothetical protein